MKRVWGLFLIFILSVAIASATTQIINNSKLTPSNPPAGISTTFYIVSESNENVSLTYEWNFGDNSSVKKSFKNNISHTYEKVGLYNISVLVTQKSINQTNISNFIINTSSPKLIINKTLISKNESLNKVIQEINKEPIWIKDKLSAEIKIADYEADIKRLSKKYNETFNDEDYVKIIKELLMINFPEEILLNSKEFPGFLTKENEIDPEIIGKVGVGSAQGYEDEYKNAILLWQDNNAEVKIETDLFTLVKENGDKTPIIRTYKIIIKSQEDSFLVINKNKNSIFFKDLTDSKNIDESTVIDLFKNQQKIIEFYYVSGQEETSFFASPSLSAFVIDTQINENCNFNNMCEEGEDYKTCRSDCKPTYWIIFWIIVIIIFIIILYTILQIWYKLRYEDSLFGDRRYLYNLLMYIHNARKMGLQDDQIRRELKNKKWSGERITYAINKSWGKSNGLYELIPIDWLIEKKRNNNVNLRYTTPPRQQFDGNINKSRFQ